MLNQITSFFFKNLLQSLLNVKLFKKTKNAWSLIFFNAQVLPTSELFIVESFLASRTRLSGFKLKNFLKLVFKNEM